MDPDIPQNLQAQQYTIIGDVYITEVQGAGAGASANAAATGISATSSDNSTMESKAQDGASEAVDDIVGDDEASDEIMSDVSSLDSCGLEDPSEVNESFVNEFTNQLASSGPIGAATAAAISTTRRRNRSLTFEINPAIRKRQQTRLLRKMKALLEEYTARVGQQAAVLCCTPGPRSQPAFSFRVFGSKPLETAIRDHRGSIISELEQALVEHTVQANISHPTASNTIDSCMGGQGCELPPLTVDGIPTPVDKMTQAQLRMFIPEMLRHSTGRSKPGWGKDECCPEWWPPDVPWANVRSDVRSEELKKQFPWTEMLKNIILSCYRYHGREDLIPDYNSSLTNPQGYHSNPHSYRSNSSLSNPLDYHSNSSLSNSSLSSAQDYHSNSSISNPRGYHGNSLLSNAQGYHSNLLLSNGSGELAQGSTLNGVVLVDDLGFTGSQATNIVGRVSGGLGSNSNMLSDGRQTRIVSPLNVINVKTGEVSRRNQTQQNSASQPLRSSLSISGTSQAPRKHVIITNVSRNKIGNAQATASPTVWPINTAQGRGMKSVPIRTTNSTQSGIFNIAQSGVLNTLHSGTINTTQFGSIFSTHSGINITQVGPKTTINSRVINPAQAGIIKASHSGALNASHARILNASHAGIIHTIDSSPHDTLSTTNFLHLFTHQAENISTMSSDLHLLSQDISDADIADLPHTDSSTNDSRGYNGMGVDCMGELQLLADENSRGVDEISLELHDIKERENGDEISLELHDIKGEENGECRNNMSVDCNLLNSGSSLCELVSDGAVRPIQVEFICENGDPIVEVSTISL